MRLGAATRVLAAAPITLPMLGGAAILLWMAAERIGFPPSVWLPGGLALLGLLAVAGVTLPHERPWLPAPVAIAAGALAAFTAWSYLTIVWAGDPGLALEGANRTALYLVVFLLFAAWGQRGTAGAVVGVTLVAGVGAIGLVQLARVARAADDSLFTDGRLAALSGYQNADAALWLMAAWAALAGAGGRAGPAWLRAGLVALAVVLADLALMAHSRGAILAAPFLAVALIAVSRAKVLTLVALGAAAAAVAVSAPTVLAVRDRVLDEAPKDGWLASGPRATVLAALGAGVVAGLVSGWLASRPRPHRPERAKLPARWVAALAGLALLTAGGVALAAGAERHAREAWDSFAEGSQPAQGDRDRLTSGLGSNRHDFYRVALDAFAGRPLHGVGADNFAQDYLRERRSEETPAYPHSIQMRTLSQTGLVGGALLAIALAAGLLGALRGTRRPGAGGPVAAGGLLAFLYWLVHGSVDWFWEFAGLGGLAFAGLGLACSLAPRGALWEWARPPLRTLGGAAAWPLALALAAAFAGPWLAGRQVQLAAGDVARDPARALARLQEAERLNPFSAQPARVAGTIALRIGDVAVARDWFRAALDRVPDDAYATFELGAIEATYGDRRTARRLLERARALNPRDPLTRQALAGVRAGRPVSVEELNAELLRRARSFE